MALVLSRKEGEEIVLVEAGVIIRIEDIKGNRVQVSIEAPKDVRVMALVLSRKEGEEIVLVEAGVIIRIEDIKGNRVQVSIEAPKDVRVMRREIMNQPPRKKQA